MSAAAPYCTCKSPHDRNRGAPQTCVWAPEHCGLHKWTTTNEYIYVHEYATSISYNVRMHCAITYGLELQLRVQKKYTLCTLYSTVYGYVIPSYSISFDACLRVGCRGLGRIDRYKSVELRHMPPIQQLNYCIARATMI